MSEWILAITIIYQSGTLTKVEPHHIYGFKTEKACLRHAALEDKSLKRIKSQTNIKSYDFNCYGR